MYLAGLLEISGLSCFLGSGRRAFLFMELLSCLIVRLGQRILMSFRRRRIGMMEIKDSMPFEEEGQHTLTSSTRGYHMYA